MRLLIRGIYIFLLLACGMELPAQILPYTVAKVPWPAGYGNHRAVLQTDVPSAMVRAKICWRRHDPDPEKKRFLIVRAEDGEQVQNIYRVSVTAEYGEIIFGPVNRPGTYYFYYLPYKTDPDAGYYRYGYLLPETPDSQWLKQLRPEDTASRQIRTGGDASPGRIPLARCTELQARTMFDSFYPMEVIPTAAEKSAYLAKHDGDFLLFPEDRRYPVKMQDEIPWKWINTDPAEEFTGTANRNEYYTFQIALYAARSAVQHIRVLFSPLSGPGNHSLPSSSLTCFNTGGVNSQGRPFVKRLDVPKGRVQVLWIGVDIPSGADPGIYRGRVTVLSDGSKPRQIALRLRITDQMLADRGDSESWRFSRLRWLNSRAGITDKPVSPYTPVRFIGGKTFCFAGKQLDISSGELPDRIRVQGMDMLYAPIRCIVPGEYFTKARFHTDTLNEGKLARSWTAYSENFVLHGKSSMEFDGYLHYAIRITALRQAELKDFRLEIPLKKKFAAYMMGMGLPGTVTPDSVHAKWGGPHDSFWIGNVSGGIYCELSGPEYHGPLLNLYHPDPPASWNNGGKGTFSLRTDGEEVLADVSSGSRVLDSGREITFEFNLIVTPVKTIDTRRQFDERYYHNGNDPKPDSVALAAGVKVINIHQGNPYNPYINYPFLAKDSIKPFADYWHSKGLKVKIYYTVRELTDHTPEIWALRSLGQEVLSGGKGGGFPWLREHFVSDYTTAWYTPVGNDPGNIDAAVETAGDSRWYNYYVRGLDWLVKNEDIDGLYLDDVAFDRHIIKRMREVLESNRKGCLVDLHSNTGFSIGPAIQYTEFFPFIDKLWFGESFRYDEMPPANWLVECSGIPFGLMGDMLQGGGNPWRGMVYGMTTRLPWFTEGVTCNPISIWKIWDLFGIRDAHMIGYWDKEAVVSTSDPNVLVTAYTRKGKTLLALASWAPRPVTVRLKVNWKALGLDPAHVTWKAPQIEGFQHDSTFSIDSEIPVDPKKGWLLLSAE